MNKQKILIIDDEFPIRYLVEHQLRREGYDILLAKNGSNGIQMAHLHQPDLIILDVMMPEVDGFTVCQEIRNNPETEHIPIIFLTALESKEQKARAYAVGADDYLIKPFQGEELVAHVNALLQRVTPIKTGALKSTKGHVISFYSPKGGVGTTTLSIQLAEAVSIQQKGPTILIDLDLPLGGIAPMLNLYTRYNILQLLEMQPTSLTLATIQSHIQKHRTDLGILVAPGKLIPKNFLNKTHQLEAIITILKKEGVQVILDLGSDLNPLTQQAMNLSDKIFMVTSGQAIANKLYNAFAEQAHHFGLHTNQLLPVINELYGSIEDEDVPLPRIPIARIAQTHELSRTRLWLNDQGMRKLLSMVL